MAAKLLSLPLPRNRPRRFFLPPTTDPSICRKITRAAKRLSGPFSFWLLSRLTNLKWMTSMEPRAPGHAKTNQNPPEIKQVSLKNADKSRG